MTKVILGTFTLNRALRIKRHLTEHTNTLLNVWLEENAPAVTVTVVTFREITNEELFHEIADVLAHAI